MALLDECITAQEAGDLLGVDKQIVSQHCRLGTIRSRKTGKGIWLIEKQDLLEKASKIHAVGALSEYRRRGVKVDELGHVKQQEQV